MQVGDLVVYKVNFRRSAKQFPGCMQPGHERSGGGIITWVEDTDSVTYTVVVDWGNRTQQVISYMLEVMR
jgi:hypothetical protein